MMCSLLQKWQGQKSELRVRLSYLHRLRLLCLPRCLKMSCLWQRYRWRLTKLVLR